MLLNLMLILLSLYDVQALLKSRQPTTKIIGGSQAPDSGIPYQASLRRLSNAHFCGGAVLDKRWILTAAHCGIEFTPDTMVVVVGSNKLVTGGETYEVDKIINHEKYNSTKITNDICLIRLNKDMKLSDKVRPIALPTSDTEPGANVLLTGWGKAKGPDDPIPNDLQMLNQTVISVRSCQIRFTFINTVTSSELCTVTLGHKGACQGDSGGPIVEGNEIVGVVSWGVKCAHAYPDVNTRVYSYVDWIKKHMEDMD